MSTFNGLTIDEAIKQEKLIPIDTQDPSWVDKLTKMVVNQQPITKPDKQQIV